MARAGAKLVLIPRDDDPEDQKDWLRDTGEVVAAGLPAEAALRAMTLEPAMMLGLDEQLGSLDVGKAANLIFLNGDPFEPGTEIEAVMLDGDFVSGEVKL
jgi:imidazolonepropionase-like amidohydrolase